MTLVIGLVLAIGLFFHTVAAIGVVRLPDFYTRLHAVSKAETLGVLCTLAAIVLWVGPSLTAVKIGFVAAFLFLTNPTSAHALGRAALRSGLAPWRRARQPS